MNVCLDPSVALLLDAAKLTAVDYSRQATGMASTLWVTCPRCAIGRGDPCRSGETCEERITANATRLMNLPTFAVAIRSPCCGQPVWLLWRQADDRIRWSGVPCSKCWQTCTVEFYASDLTQRRIRVQRVHPVLVEMACWALESWTPAPSS